MNEPIRGVLLVLTGPSGAGKSTLVRALQDVNPGLAFSVSATTRAPRPGETNGVEYWFVTENEFGRMRDSDLLLEHATVYNGSYGTPRAPVIEALEAGRCALLDIDVKGALQVRAALPEAVLVFIAPPDRRTLEVRLRKRGTESDAVIERRMAAASEQLAGVVSYDYVLVNEDLVATTAALIAIATAEQFRVSRRAIDVRRLVAMSGE